MKVKGLVEKHLGRGRDLGFPTANLNVKTDLEEGIYLAKAEGLPAMAFVGSAITFGDTKKVFEVYILDFAEDLYGKEIEVEMIKKIRDNKKFNSKEELVLQMKSDEQVAREYFKL